MCRMNSYSRTQLLFGSLVAVVIILGVGYVFWQGAHKPGFHEQRAATTTAGTTTMQVSPTTMIVTTPGGSSYTITQIPISNPPAAPAYKGAVPCPSDMSGEQCASIQSQDAAIVGKLNASRTDFAAWIDLGMLRETTGDYQGAVTAWNYVAAIYPTNPAAFANLGDLYTNFTHDYAKADASYLAAIKDDPSDTSFYKNLFTLYTTTSYTPGATAAEDILKKGIAANPKAVDLQVTLARYYKTLGRTADAKVEYDAAIANAISQGQTALAAQIQQEEAAQ
jgi:tetratricopeptide (TPR) repeat protein